jgi:hypothetical protein
MRERIWFEERSSGLRFWSVIIADGGHGADVSDDAEHLGSNVGQPG